MVKIIYNLYKISIFFSILDIELDNIKSRSSTTKDVEMILSAVPRLLIELPTTFSLFAVLYILRYYPLKRQKLAM